VRNLIKFIIRFHFFLLFLLLEIISLTLAINNSSHHNKKFFSSANFISAGLFSGIDAVGQYLNLRTVNKTLAIENRVLRNNLATSYIHNYEFKRTVRDSLYSQQYKYIDAKVVNNSINKQQNYITLNKGSKQGVGKDMAVISSTGVVGIVYDVTPNFSTVISLLNVNYKISAKLKNEAYFGSLYWDAIDYRYCILSEIPYHVDIDIGDTVVTNSFSNIYPEGVLIGTIKEYNKTKHDNFYNIKVELSTDFQSVEYVYVIKDLLKEERLTLEKLTRND
jgi:rod shape-determining protein MreC